MEEFKEREFYQQRNLFRILCKHSLYNEPLGDVFIHLTNIEHSGKDSLIKLNLPGLSTVTCTVRDLELVLLQSFCLVEEKFLSEVTVQPLLPKS